MLEASRIFSWLIAACIALYAASARADPDLTLHLQLETQPSVFAYRQVELQRPNYVRATLEGITILTLELVNYIHDHDLNSRDWDFSYDWIGLRKKLSGSGYSFDTNNFDTNFITHPFAGTLYYSAARSNRMSVFESLLFAFMASAIWEYFGELRERASINDLLSTPVAGLVLGETMLQLGLFFDRSCDSVANRTLGSVFGPFKSVHDALDSAELVRDVTCDRHSMSLRGDHEFRLTVASGSVLSVQPRVPARVETRIALRTRVIALDDYTAPGIGLRNFADGNVTELELSGGWAGATWNDFSLRAEVIPFGIHYRDLAPSRAGLYGYEVLFGLLVGTEYDVHRFLTHRGPTSQDRFFAIDLPGAALLYRRAAGHAHLDLELQASVALAGVDAFALPVYVRSNSLDELTSIARAHHYNYGAGFRVAPRARFACDWFDAGAELASTVVALITAQDRNRYQSHVAGSEQRTRAKIWLSVAPRETSPFRLTLEAGLLHRSGQLADARAERTELQLLGALEAAL